MVNVLHALLVVLATHFLAMQRDEFRLQARNVLSKYQINWKVRVFLRVKYVQIKRFSIRAYNWLIFKVILFIISSQRLNSKKPYITDLNAFF